MRRLAIVICILFFGFVLNAQYSWTLRPCLPGAPRTATASFSVGNKGYVICGFTATALNGISEVWEFDDATNTWTQKNNFPSARQGPAVFVINDTAYAGEGLSAGGFLTDFYRYDAANDAWIPLANFPGTPRYFSMTFTLNGKGYLGCGKGNTQYGDFFEYDPQANTWTQKANFPGSARQNGFGISVGQYGYMGAGYDGGMFADSYKYDPTTDTWTAIANFGGGARYGVGYFAISDTFYVLAGRDPYHDDCWRYDVATNTWIQQSSFTCIAPPRAAACGFAINGHGYTCTGDLGNGIYTNDFLEFGPTDVRFTQRIHVLGNDTSYCGNFSRVLSTGNPCTLWSTGVTASQITVNSPGTYWARLPDTCGMAADTIQISEGIGTTVNLGNDTTLCQGETLVLHATGPYTTYSWQNNTSDSIFSVTGPGIYSVTVSNSAGCSASGSINVSYVSHTPVFSLGGDTAYCGPFGRILSTGVANTVWSTGAISPQITVTVPGTYWAAESNACGSGSDTISIVQNPVPNVYLGPDTVLCTGEALLLNAANGNLTYMWQDSSSGPSFNVTQAGTYSVTVTNNTNCTASDEIMVTYLSPPAPFSIGNDTAYCGDFSRNLSTGDSATLWSTGVTSAQITATLPGLYWANESNVCGLYSDTIILVQNPVTLVNLGDDTTLCAGGSLVLNVAGQNLTYRWQDNSTNSTFNVTSAGLYTVSVTNSFSCTTMDSIRVGYVSQKPDLFLGTDTTYCQQFTRTLITGIASTLWSTNVVDSEITINEPGTYWALAANACGATADTIVISEASPPEVMFTGVFSVCPGESVVLRPNTSGMNFIWNTGQTTDSIIVNQPGSYEVKTWNDIACPASAAIEVSKSNVPAIYLGNDTTICGSTGILLSLNVPNATYRWQDNSVDSFYNITASGTYAVTVSNGCGSATAQKKVEMYLNECDLLIPTGFSPNGDGKNDIFHAISFCPLDRFSINIYNRWGQLVYESTDITVGWDGTFEGVPQPVDVFVYYAEYFNYCKNAMDKKTGNITLIR